MLNHVIISQAMWDLSLQFIGTAEREACLGSYCGDPVGEEAALAEEFSSWTVKKSIRRDWMGLRRVAGVLSVLVFVIMRGGILPIIPMTNVYKCMTEVPGHSHPGLEPVIHPGNSSWAPWCSLAFWKAVEIHRKGHWNGGQQMEVCVFWQPLTPTGGLGVSCLASPNISSLLCHMRKIYF